MAHPRTLGELVAQQAADRPHDRAVILLSDTGTERDVLQYGELYTRADALARKLAILAPKGARAVLMMPTCAEFVVSFFACMLAGIVAVPVMPPRRLAHRDSSSPILKDCAPQLLLTVTAMADGARSERLHQDGIAWLCVDDMPALDQAPLPAVHPHDLALLQYTSGSTSQPKGVMVGHDNLLSNLGAIRQAMGNSSASTYVNWGPMYHDMGLVMDLLQPLFLGAPAVLLRPAGFMQKPLLWLKAIHDYRAEVAGAPNFAFDLCVTRLRPEQMMGVDLSHWKLAFNGAEPVRAQTMERFAKAFAPWGFQARTLCPCYGLAEATLMVSGMGRGEGVITRTVSRAGLLAGRIDPPADDADARLLTASGRAIQDTQIAIVDGEGRRTSGIGEIWLSGPGVTQGYWQSEAATETSFRAQIAGEAGHWLRTGDLGFREAQGLLFVTGRIKDMLIIRGTNHYPQDIEETVQHAHPVLGDNGAVFAAGENSERIVVAYEVGRFDRHGMDARAVEDAVREAVACEHELSVQEVVLLRPGSLPKTTSGKVQRSLTARLWQENALQRL